MKRSRINDIITEADEMMRSFGFVMPPFAYWSPDEFKARKDIAKNVIDARCGWDITGVVRQSLTGLKAPRSYKSMKRRFETTP